MNDLYQALHNFKTGHFASQVNPLFLHMHKVGNGQLNVHVIQDQLIKIYQKCKAFSSRPSSTEDTMGVYTLLM